MRLKDYKCCSSKPEKNYNPLPVSSLVRKLLESSLEHQKSRLLQIRIVCGKSLCRRNPELGDPYDRKASGSFVEDTKMSSYKGFVSRLQTKDNNTISMGKLNICKTKDKS